MRKRHQMVKRVCSGAINRSDVQRKYTSQKDCQEYCQTDYSGNKTHNRHIPFEECRGIGLDVDPIEDDPELQDLLLTVHHCFMHSLMNTTAYKLIENHLGAAFVKHQAQTVVMQQVP